MLVRVVNGSDKTVKKHILLQKCPQRRKRNILLYVLFLFEIVTVRYQI